MEEPELTVNSADEKEDEDLDGIPLDGAALLKGALLRGIPQTNPNSPIEKSTRRNHGSDSDYDDDIDGIPCKFAAIFKTIKFHLRSNLNLLYISMNSSGR